MNECKQCKHRAVCRYRIEELQVIASALFECRRKGVFGEITIAHNCKHYDWDYEWSRETEEGGDTA